MALLFCPSFLRRAGVTTLHAMEKLLRSKLPAGSFGTVSVSRSRIMSGIRGRNNHSTEIPLRMGLIRRGIGGWKLHVKALPGCPDFFFIGGRIAVFVDGCFWHGCPRCGHLPRTNPAFWHTKITRNRERDERNTRRLRGRGYRVLRFWEHDIMNDLDACITRIAKALSDQKHRKRNLAHN